MYPLCLKPSSTRVYISDGMIQNFSLAADNLGSVIKVNVNKWLDTIDYDKEVYYDTNVFFLDDDRTSPVNSLDYN